MALRTHALVLLRFEWPFAPTLQRDDRCPSSGILGGTLLRVLFFNRPRTSGNKNTEGFPDCNAGEKAAGEHHHHLLVLLFLPSPPTHSFFSRRFSLFLCFYLFTFFPPPRRNCEKRCGRGRRGRRRGPLTRSSAGSPMMIMVIVMVMDRISSPSRCRRAEGKRPARGFVLFGRVRCCLSSFV